MLLLKIYGEQKYEKFYNIDADMINYSEIGTDLLAEREEEKLKRKTSVLILHKEDTAANSLPEVRIIIKEPIKIDTTYFCIDSDETPKRPDKERAIFNKNIEGLKEMSEPIIARRG